MPTEEQIAKKPYTGVFANYFKRNSPERLSTRSMENFSYELRKAKARSSCQPFSKRARERLMESLFFNQDKAEIKSPVRGNCDIDQACRDMRERKKLAQQRVQEASKKLMYWRLINNKLTGAILDTELKMLHEREICDVLSYYMAKPAGIPQSIQTGNVLYIKQLTFGIRKYSDWDYEFGEHFMCMVVYQTDVRVTTLVSLTKDSLVFPDCFQYEAPEENFYIYVKLFSIKDKQRSTFSKTKQFLKKAFSSSSLESEFKYHGWLSITKEHTLGGASVDFRHQERKGRVGKVSIKVALTNPYKVNDVIYSTLECNDFRMVAK